MSDPKTINQKQIALSLFYIAGIILFIVLPILGLVDPIGSFNGIERPATFFGNYIDSFFPVWGGAIYLAALIYLLRRWRHQISKKCTTVGNFIIIVLGSLLFSISVLFVILYGITH